MSTNSTVCLANRLSQAPRSRRRPRKPHRSRPAARLLLEQLEVRLTPSTSPLSSLTFPESGVLRELEVSNGALRVFYSDEHALTLGVSSVTLDVTGRITSGSNTITNITTASGLTPGLQVGDSVT